MARMGAALRPLTGQHKPPNVVVLVQTFATVYVLAVIVKSYGYGIIRACQSLEIVQES